jgi:dihydrofolate synthase/folylpolyglutamate synthase
MRSPDALEWLEGLTPWPQEFGLGRMHALLERLGNPERAFDAIHVVGTNGKSTTTRMIEELLLAEGLRAGAYVSPHVTGWRERVRIGDHEADLARALDRVRPDAEAVGATQFEVLTAAAFAEFRENGVEAAAVEAGLGGRLDATNVLQSKVVVLTNVGLEHTEWLGTTRAAIAAEKLAVIRPGAPVILGEPEWEALARRNGAGEVLVVTTGNLELAQAAVETCLGREVDPEPAATVSLPGRLEVVGDEIRDGAHTPEAVRYIAPRLPQLGSIVVSMLEDKDVDGVLRELAVLCATLVATTSSSPRALPASELAARARPLFERVEVVEPPADAVARARELGRPVLVTGSLYLLSDLAQVRRVPWVAPPTS